MKKKWLILLAVINVCNIWAAEADRPELTKDESIRNMKSVGIYVGGCAGVVVICIGARRYLPVTRKYLDTKIDGLKEFMTKDVRNYLADKIDSVSKKLTDFSGEFRSELRGAEGRLSKQIKDSACETNSKIDVLSKDSNALRKAMEDCARQQTDRYTKLDEKIQRILEIVEKAHQQ